MLPSQIAPNNFTNEHRKTNERFFMLRVYTATVNEPGKPPFSIFEGCCHVWTAPFLQDKNEL